MRKSQVMTGLYDFQLLSPNQFTGSVAGVFAGQRAFPVPFVAAIDSDQVAIDPNDMSFADVLQPLGDVAVCRNNMHVGAVFFNFLERNWKLFDSPIKKSIGLPDLDIFENIVIGHATPTDRMAVSRRAFIVEIIKYCFTIR